jgi:hypothetical protein
MIKNLPQLGQQTGQNEHYQPPIINGPLDN